MSCIQSIFMDSEYYAANHRTTFVALPANGEKGVLFSAWADVKRQLTSKLPNIGYTILLYLGMQSVFSVRFSGLIYLLSINLLY